MIPIDLTSLRRSGLAGRGVRVAVVDSGVNARHPHVGGIAGGVGITLDPARGVVLDDEDTVDRLGHGTACAGVIRWRAPAARIHAVKIFHRDLTAHALALVEAIRWCIDHRMDLVNLSLGTRSAAAVPALRVVCREAHAAGILLVAAEREPDAGSYPAAFPEVLGAVGDESCPPGTLYYRPGARIELVGPTSPRPLPGVSPERNFRGGSFAGAHVSAALALLRERHPGVGARAVRRWLVDGGGLQPPLPGVLEGA